ncbi:hypothetical protein [Sinanaerobacter sp. ZZT-01]|uniref:hypothetical protein n=1 Tax=Sinanaerobacter sp. ZZT-01 TaxID=3111540 RepID=UPI002D78F0BE|nr:hypothetical protein [Sinanaerobacter sp. ZZT-01]WRR93382.1 hypothetical protein U5921_15335 [Sinanaerobacter sp. ZZT-01]
MKWRKENKSHEEKELNLKELIGIKDIKRGIIVCENSYTLPLEVLPVNFDLKSKGEKNYIIESYEELLKKVKTPFQIYTFARRADAKAHLDHMRKHLMTEENETVREMLQEYMQFVSDVSYKSAVKKRFIVMIPYVVPAGFSFKEIDFNDAAAWLIEKRTQFVDAFRKCGNDTVIPNLSEENRFTAQILFELFNIKSSERLRMVKL